jgi:hypothetical protein
VSGDESALTASVSLRVDEPQRRAAGTVFLVMAATALPLLVWELLLILFESRGPVSLYVWMITANVRLHYVPDWFGFLGILLTAATVLGSVILLRRASRARVSYRVARWALYLGLADCAVIAAALILTLLSSTWWTGVS